jgi:hypothetical protein
MSAPLDDPRFPNRPSHPDFARIADASLQLDGQVGEGERELLETTAEVVDPESVMYAARSRTAAFLAGFGIEPHEIPHEVLAMLSSAWVDGFAIGARFQEKGGKRG